MKLIVTCEHGGNRVPARFRDAFRAHGEILASHRGFDPGALEIARLFAKRLEAPLHATTVTRLVVDTNRSIGHRSLFSELVRHLPQEHKEEALRQHYHPHRERVEATVKELSRSRRTVVHVASHSFTPELAGVARTADVAWLYDPRRRGERVFVDAWREALRGLLPHLRLRRNYPYKGVADGLTTHLRKVFPADTYLGIELEVNQASMSAELRAALAESLARALSSVNASERPTRTRGARAPRLR